MLEIAALEQQVVETEAFEVGCRFAVQTAPRQDRTAVALAFAAEQAALPLEQLDSHRENSEQLAMVAGKVDPEGPLFGQRPDRLVKDWPQRLADWALVVLL